MATNHETHIRDPDKIDINITVDPTHLPPQIPTKLGTVYDFSSTATSILETRPTDPNADRTNAATTFRTNPEIPATTTDPAIPACKKQFLRTDFLTILQNIVNLEIIRLAIHSFTDLKASKCEESILNLLTQFWQVMTLPHHHC